MVVFHEVYFQVGVAKMKFKEQKTNDSLISGVCSESRNDIFYGLNCIVLQFIFTQKKQNYA